MSAESCSPVRVYYCYLSFVLITVRVYSRLNMDGGSIACVAVVARSKRGQIPPWIRIQLTTTGNASSSSQPGTLVWIFATVINAIMSSYIFLPRSNVGLDKPELFDESGGPIASSLANQLDRFGGIDFPYTLDVSSHLINRGA